jgi:hypothetical protein
MNIKRLLLIIFSLLLTAVVYPAQAQNVSGDLLGRINGLRGELGLPGYTLNGILSAAAQNQAEWMVTSGQVSHTQPDGSTPSSRATRLGYPSSAVSENIYMGTNATASVAWNWWLNSPIHYRGITNAAYTQVGVGTAIGEAGQAFVLVFGNPNGWGAAPARPAPPASNNGGSSASSGGAAAPPVFVVGVDNDGNIMHEIQPGHTLGEIVLMYGYGWDDLDRVRRLNTMSEPEGRNLAVGSVLLIPPWGSTETPLEVAAPDVSPTPVFVIQVTPGPTENAIVLRSDAISPMPEASPVEDLGIIGAEVTTEETPAAVAAQPTQSWQAVTITPSLDAGSGGTAVAIAIEPPADPQIIMVETNDTSPLLIVAVVLQLVIIGGAGFEFWRRRSR